MAAIRDEAISRGPGTMIFNPCDIQERDGFNTRDMESPETQQHIREMADAIKENGNEAFPPITIYKEDGVLYVSAGWCRRRAHVLAMKEGAPIKGILCLSTTKKRPEEITLDVLTSNDGLPLTVLEKAKAIQKLKSFMWTVAEISRKTGWSISTINNLLSIADAPTEITQLVKDGKVSATLATKMIRERGEAGAVKALKDAVKTSASAGKTKATEKDIDRIKTTSISWRGYGPKLFKLAKSICETPATESNKVWQKIAEMNEIVAEIEDQQQNLEL